MKIPLFWPGIIALIFSTQSLATPEKELSKIRINSAELIVKRILSKVNHLGKIKIKSYKI